MKVCILDNGITSLTLAKALVNQKIYVDIISNLPFQLFANSLFMNNSESNDIIPHYFEPFLRKNIQVFYETDNKNLFFFKGDADGDNSISREEFANYLTDPSIQAFFRYLELDLRK